MSKESSFLEVPLPEIKVNGSPSEHCGCSRRRWVVLKIRDFIVRGTVELHTYSSTVAAGLCKLLLLVVCDEVRCV
jgi:hypothetical protein